PRSLFKTRNRALATEIASLERAADLPSTILILGESGTGKDRLARAVHDVSSRASRPFVRIDAANLSDELFESELFGHERGAFTGAIAAKKGLLQGAEDGTVYLDEVSSLSPRPRRPRHVPPGAPGAALPPPPRRADPPLPGAADPLVPPRPLRSRRAGRIPRRLLLPHRRRIGAPAEAARPDRGRAAARARLRP